MSNDQGSEKSSHSSDVDCNYGAEALYSSAFAFRLFSIEVPSSQDPGKDSVIEVHGSLLERIQNKLMQLSM